MNKDVITTVKNPMLVGGAQRADQHQGSAMALSESAKTTAEVQAALTVAIANPRDTVRAVDRILNQFARPTLAEVSQYAYSKGGTDITGLSIRAAEAIAQQWGNLNTGFKELSRTKGYDGVGVSEVSAFAWDLETNMIKQIVFHVRHWRDKKNGGGYALTDERDIYELMANMAQRRLRACILAVIPADVQEAAINAATETLSAHADTGSAAMSKMVESFAEFGVTKEHIEARIQRRIEAIQPAQVINLKRVYRSLRDGMSSPSDWFDIQGAQQEGGTGAAEAASINDQINKVQQKSQAKAPAKKKAASKKKAAAKKDAPFTFAQIAEKITKADTLDKVYDAQALISDDMDDVQRKELGKLANTKMLELQD